MCCEKQAAAWSVTASVVNYLCFAVISNRHVGIYASPDNWRTCLHYLSVYCSHAESLAAVKAYMSWLCQFYSLTHRDGSHSATHHHTASSTHEQQQQSDSVRRCDAMITSTLDATVPLFTTQRHVCHLSPAVNLLTYFLNLWMCTVYCCVVLLLLYIM